MINDSRELLKVTITSGNTDNRKPTMALLKDLFVKIFADKGYISQPLATQLQKQYRFILW